MTEYYKLTEVNEQEGESWSFYFEAPDNLIEALDNIVSCTDNFDLYTDTISEEKLNFLLKELDWHPGGYFNIVNKSIIDSTKISKLFELNARYLDEDVLYNEDIDNIDDEQLLEDINEFLYKGGLFE